MGFGVSGLGVPYGCRLRGPDAKRAVLAAREEDRVRHHGLSARACVGFRLQGPVYALGFRVPGVGA